MAGIANAQAQSVRMQSCSTLCTAQGAHILRSQFLIPALDYPKSRRWEHMSVVGADAGSRIRRPVFILSERFMENHGVHPVYPPLPHAPEPAPGDGEHCSCIKV
eukprot:4112522-Pleurochrysis_carterae.AAC.1